ncbi:MAG: DHA2 family efflux MFS transporter permease subunit [Porticoccaceae bacterium]
MPENPKPAAPYRELLPITLAVMTGVLSTSFSAIFANIALPDVMAEFAVAHGTAHWLITAFVTCATLTMLLAGWGANRVGVRTLFMGALVLFILSSLLGGFGTSIQAVIAARALQGASMGFISVLALMALFASFPVERRGRAGALFGLGMALAPTTGPTLSGFIVEWWSWRGIFFAPIALALLSLALAFRLMPALDKGSRGASRPFDWVGFVLIVIFLALLFGATSYLRDHHWPPRPLLLTLTLLAVVLALLVRYEIRRAHPLLSLHLFRYPVFTASACVSFVYGMGLWGSGYLIALYLQDGLGLSAMTTGLVMLPSGLLLCLLLPLGGKLVDDQPPQRVVTLGVLFSVVAFMALGFTGVSTGLWVFAALIAISRGLGMGIMIPGLDATATRGLPPGLMNEGIAMANFLRQLGGAMSANVLMLVYEWRLAANQPEPDAVITSYQETSIFLGLVFLVAVIPALRMRVGAQGIR